MSGRNTKGVHCIALGKTDSIASIECVPPEENDGEEHEEGGVPVAAAEEEGEASGTEVEDLNEKA